MKKYTGAVIGVLIVLAGIILGLNSLGITNIDIFFAGWWTLLLIIPCTVGIIKGRDRTANIIGLVIGVVLLLAEQNVISYTMLAKLIIPVLVVYIGIVIIRGSVKKF